MLSIATKIILVLFLLLYLYLGTVNIPSNVAASFNDLVAHGLGYFILMIVAATAFPKKTVLLTIAFACFAYSVFIECVQFLLPYRSFSLLDIVANGLGVVCGFLLLILFWPVFQRIMKLLH